MTMDNMLSHVGLAPKTYTGRYPSFQYNNRPILKDYPSSFSFQHRQEHYDPPTLTAKHHHGHSSHKSNAAMSALTLLAFLFFLNILQQCLKEHMTTMTAAPVVVMSTREGETGNIVKMGSEEKIDKSGILELNKTKVKRVNAMADKHGNKKPERFKDSRKQIETTNYPVSHNDIDKLKSPVKEGTVIQLSSIEVNNNEGPYTKVELAEKPLIKNTKEITRYDHQSGWYRDHN